MLAIPWYLHGAGSGGNEGPGAEKAHPRADYDNKDQGKRGRKTRVSNLILFKVGQCNTVCELCFPQGRQLHKVCRMHLPKVETLPWYRTVILLHDTSLQIPPSSFYPRISPPFRVCLRFLEKRKELPTFRSSSPQKYTHPGPAYCNDQARIRTYVLYILRFQHFNS